jgi:tetratricopeptide (TPR) repeat protein
MVDTAIADRPAGTDATARLRDVIKQIHSAAEPLNDMPMLEPALREAADGWRDARRLLVSPLVREGKLGAAIAALEIMVAVYPARADERRLLASLFGRTEQWDRAIAEADAAAGIEPGAAALHAARIQLRVQAGRVAEAAEVARATRNLAENEPTLG